MLSLTPLEGRDTPSVVAYSGGVVYRVQPDGSNAALFQPFEDAAKSLTVTLAEEDGLIYVGAGPGGGPRLQARRSDTFQTVFDVFIGDPDSRTGVPIAPGTPPPKAPELRNILTAEPHPAIPGDVRAANNAIRGIPEFLQERLLGVGVRTLVYNAPAVTALPEFADLTGRLTDAGGDGDRTFDQVDAVGTGFLPMSVTVSTGSAARTVRHELGHAYSFYCITDAQREAFIAVWPTIQSWPTAYEFAQWTEAYADCWTRFTYGSPQVRGMEDFANLYL